VSGSTCSRYWQSTDHSPLAPSEALRAIALMRILMIAPTLFACGASRRNPPRASRRTPCRYSPARLSTSIGRGEGHPTVPTPSRIGHKAGGGQRGTPRRRGERRGRVVAGQLRSRYAGEAVLGGARRRPVHGTQSGYPHQASRLPEKPPTPLREVYGEHRYVGHVVKRTELTTTAVGCSRSTSREPMPYFTRSAS
jgi:hypothetical protein